MPSPVATVARFSRLTAQAGLNADTGHSYGATIRASHTISFIAGKPGLLTAEGADCCGEISIASLGLDVQNIHPASGHGIDISGFSQHLGPRRRNSHKGSYGNAGILGGAPGMAGAALLAARAAPTDSEAVGSMSDCLKNMRQPTTHCNLN